MPCGEQRDHPHRLGGETGLERGQRLGIAHLRHAVVERREDLVRLVVGEGHIGSPIRMERSRRRTERTPDRRQISTAADDHAVSKFSRGPYSRTVGKRPSRKLWAPNCSGSKVSESTYSRTAGRGR